MNIVEVALTEVVNNFLANQPDSRIEQMFANGLPVNKSMDLLPHRLTGERTGSFNITGGKNYVTGTIQIYQRDMFGSAFNFLSIDDLNVESITVTYQGEEHQCRVHSEKATLWYTISAPFITKMIEGARDRSKR